jgi:hypothetical protein
MNLYAVRIFKDRKWHPVRYYSTKQEAEDFAQGLEIEWDVKEISLQSALDSELKPNRA